MPGQGDLLDWLRGRYRLAVVSNFDYTPTVLRILADGGILGRFETVIVSDTVGWRKPRPVIFERALADMGLAPSECPSLGTGRTSTSGAPRESAWRPPGSTSRAPSRAARPPTSTPWAWPSRAALETGPKGS